ncbi:glycosyltransferase family 31 protein, partial [Lentithecium fluviatile CBS 122367]
DWWHRDTPTRFGAYDKNAQGEVGCGTFPEELLERTQVVLQVGTADDPRRTKAQLASVIKCVDNVIIVSDKNHTYGASAHEAIDVLAFLPAKTYLKESDYAIYERQKTAPNGEGDPEAWKLDKYKFLPGIEYAVAQSPNAEWFVFLQPDTYFFWDNVFRLLENYDYTLPYYFGSPSPGHVLPPDDANAENPIWYAFNGPGFILSHATAHRLVDRPTNALGVRGPRLAVEYADRIREDCCGDSILAWALHDKADVRLSGLWPMFNPRGIADPPFGKRKRFWCEPVVGLHGVGLEDMEGLWRWEMERERGERPLLYADLIEFTQLGRFTRRLHWDAVGAEGFVLPEGHAAHADLLACEEACREEGECYQWTWHGRHCYMSREIRVGKEGKVFEGVDAAFTSGWDTDKIRRYRHSKRCEAGPHWVRPSVERRGVRSGFRLGMHCWSLG